MASRGSEDFDTRTRELGDRVGDGTLRGRVEVDQAYAQYQHEGLDLKHPRGGQAKFLEAPLFGRHGDYLNRLAASVLAGDLSTAMADNMEDLSSEVQRLAPVEFTDLRQSGHPTVQDGPVLKYDRPPIQPRLTPAQLRAKARLRRVGTGGFGGGVAELYGY